MEETTRRPAIPSLLTQSLWIFKLVFAQILSYVKKQKRGGSRPALIPLHVVARLTHEFCHPMRVPGRTDASSAKLGEPSRSHGSAENPIHLSPVRSQLKTDSVIIHPKRRKIAFVFQAAT